MAIARARILKDPFFDAGQAARCKRLQAGSGIRRWNPTAGTDEIVWDPFNFLDPLTETTNAANSDPGPGANSDSISRYPYAGASLQAEEWTHANSLQVDPVRYPSYTALIRYNYQRACTSPVGGLKMSHPRLFVLFALFSTGAYAQWLNFPTPGTPRTPDGKPNLSAPAPRTADGKPDLSGVWMHEITSVAEMRRLYGPEIDEQVRVQVPGMEIGTQHKYFINILLDFKPGESPLRPEAAKAMRQNADRRESGNPCSRVFGFPLAGLLSEPIKIVQSPRVTVVLYEVNNQHRQIFTDGRVLPKEFELPAYLGYSAGHWDRDVLVVETAGFNDKTAFDTMGHPHSEALRVTERFHRRDFGHLDVEMTFDDPRMYTKPFTVKIPHDLLADTDIFEMFCDENEKDAAHMQKR